MIQVSNVSKTYGKTTILDHVSFEMRHHGACVISGPSGSGKSTLLRLIAGLELPDGGEVSLDGKVVSTQGWGLSPYRRKIGFVFQSPALWPHLTVTENVAFGLASDNKKENEKRVKELLAETNLAHLADRYPSNLSGGEKRRVAIARAVAARPHYLLMDEPLTNLDPALKGQLLGFILKTQRESDAFLVYVTHDETEGKAISETQFVLQRGHMTNSYRQVNRT